MLIESTYMGSKTVELLSEDSLTQWNVCYEIYHDISTLGFTTRRDVKINIEYIDMIVINPVTLEETTTELDRNEVPTWILDKTEKLLKTGL